MIVSRDDIAGRPWHLIPAGQRAWVEETIFLKADCCDGTCSTARAHQAARAALRELAPYPDEALMFSMHAEDVCELHVCVVQWDRPEVFRSTLVIDECGEFRWTAFDCLRPLTIAAHDLLETFG